MLIHQVHFPEFDQSQAGQYPFEDWLPTSRSLELFYARFTTEIKLFLPGPLLLKKQPRVKHSLGSAEFSLATYDKCWLCRNHLENGGFGSNSEGERSQEKQVLAFAMSAMQPSCHCPCGVFALQTMMQG